MKNHFSVKWGIILPAETKVSACSQLMKRGSDSLYGVYSFRGWPACFTSRSNDPPSTPASGYTSTRCFFISDIKQVLQLAKRSRCYSHSIDRETSLRGFNPKKRKKVIDGGSVSGCVL